MSSAVHMLESHLILHVSIKQNNKYEKTIELTFQDNPLNKTKNVETWLT